MFNINRKILLGSASPRRQSLFKKLGINFRVLVSNADETPLPDLERGDIATYLSKEKAEVLKKDIHENEILVTADTIVWLDTIMLGKPANSEEAFEMLRLLSGKRHEVYTGVTLTDLKLKKTFYVESKVQFRKFDDNDIRKYIQQFQPFDKAGSYGAQECLPENINPYSESEKQFLKKNGLESVFENALEINEKRHIPLIEKIYGSYFNVMGLPVVEFIEELMIFDKSFW